MTPFVNALVMFREDDYYCFRFIHLYAVTFLDVLFALASSSIGIVSCNVVCFFS
jgi:hypothetical protein